MADRRTGGEVRCESVRISACAEQPWRVKFDPFNRYVQRSTLHFVKHDARRHGCAVTTAYHYSTYFRVNFVSGNQQPRCRAPGWRSTATRRAAYDAYCESLLGEMVALAEPLG